jgi:hypothetical protein
MQRPEWSFLIAVTSAIALLEAEAGIVLAQNPTDARRPTTRAYHLRLGFRAVSAVDMLLPSWWGNRMPLGNATDAGP